ncbi:hypothetical protein BG58_21095 [Caballeronia jiangsuensis]|nr:hypothetical protein BG58_21095 [Caballeronia jiangsuensis]
MFETLNAAWRGYAFNARGHQKEDKPRITKTPDVQPNVDERRAHAHQTARANDSAQKQKPGSLDPGFAFFARRSRG